MAKCSICKTDLTPVFEGAKNQFVNALHISFDGGYGEYIDNTSAEEEAAQRHILCNDCSNDLCMMIPWIRKQLRPTWPET